MNMNELEMCIRDRGSPCIYYGTEIAMPGSYDPDCRRCMPGDDIEAGRFKERIEMVSKLIHLRASEPLLKGRNCLLYTSRCV